MRTTLRYLLTIVIGLALGLTAAIHTVRAGALGANVSIGPWQTGLDFGTAHASAKTRAVVALSGLLALPAKEARYYTASTDDSGRSLDGRCRYRVSGGTLPGRWWSLTLYDHDGYLAGHGPYSVESVAVTGRDSFRPQAEFGNAQPWTISIGPRAQGALALPTANLPEFELTLRTYLPPDGGEGNPSRDGLPSIVREGC